MKDKIRDRLFTTLASLTYKSPWFVLLAAFFLVSVSLAAVGINSPKMQTRILDLLPANDPAAIEYNDIVQQYSSASQIIVGVKGDNPTEMKRFIDEVEKHAKNATYTVENKDGTKTKVGYVKRVVTQIDKDFLSRHGMMLLKQRDLENMEELFQNLELTDLLRAYNDFFEREYIEDSGALTEREKEDRAISSLKAVMTWLSELEHVKLADGSKASLKENAKIADKVSSLLSIGDPYMLCEDDTMLIGMIVPSISIAQMEETMEGAKSLRSIVNQIKTGFPDLKVSMTGMAMLSLEETEVTEQDMGLSSVISVILVLSIFVIAFRMWTAPLLAIVNLIVGIIWTTGFIAISFGRLNLMTLMFAVILTGLGIDFAIHLNAAYSTARSRGEGVFNALKSMYLQSGAGVITGALTTAAAFVALALSGLNAFVELGIILGVGIILTLISSMVVLPAMYVVSERIESRIFKNKNRQIKPVRLSFGFLENLGNVIVRHPWPLVLAILLATGGFIWKAAGASFEPDMLEIEPANMPSVVLHREIIDKFEMHPDFAMVTTNNFDKTRTIVKQMKKNRLIGRVDAITDFLPTKKQQKKRAKITRRIKHKMQDFIEPKVTSGPPGTVPVIELPAYMSLDEVPQKLAKEFLSELKRFHQNVDEIGRMSFAAMKMRLQRECYLLTGGENKKDSKILQLANRLSKDEKLTKRMAVYQQNYIPLLAGKIEQMSDTTPLTINTIPAEIKDRYISSRGNNLITIYAAVNLWNDQKMDLFNAATSKVSQKITGTVVLMDRLIELIGSRGLIATFLALGAVFLILLLDFRHPGFALLGMIPLFVGFAWMVGGFVILGFKFDVVNVTAIPLILGIGIDDAVHVIHGTRRLGVVKLPQILKHIGRALVLTSLTTAIAFGSIGFASHRGLAGMGILLALGVGSCLFMSVVLLPALLRIFFFVDESKNCTKEVQDD